jgi:hypothetical protein
LAERQPSGGVRPRPSWVYGLKVALVVDPKGVVSAFGLVAPAASDERPIGEALIAEDRAEAYLADKGFRGLEWERRWLEVYGALVALHPEEQLPSGMVEGRSPLGDGPSLDHRGGDRPTQGLLRTGAPPGQDLERAAEPLGGQDRGVHLWATDQRFPGPSVAPPGGAVGLTRCTSAV